MCKKTKHDITHFRHRILQKYLFLLHVFTALPVLTFGKSVNFSGGTTTLPVWEDDFLHVVGHEKIVEASELIPLQECFLSPESGKTNTPFHTVCLHSETTQQMCWLIRGTKEPRCRRSAPPRHYCPDQSRSRPLRRDVQEPEVNLNYELWCFIEHR